MNTPAHIVAVAWLVDAIETSADAAIEDRRGVGERFDEPGDGGAQRPRDVQAGSLGGRRCATVSAPQAERPRQLADQLVKLGLLGLGRPEQASFKRLVGL